MVQSLDIISVNIWQIVISLINLLIIYRILKKFLFKPVQKVMDERQAQVDRIYGDANQSRTQAEQMKQEYEQRLASAREEADGLVRNAVQTAQKRSDQMVSEASAQASRIKQKANEEIAQEKKKMLQDVRSEISDLAVEIASKVVEREISPRDYDGFVDEFIRNVGENN
jgi:F-type H+-transporting ATPase subunit b